MGENLHDVYYCQMERTTELSNRMYDRNIPSHQMGMAYFARPVDTYATVMPVLDCHKKSTVEKASFPIYNQRLIFNPGSGAPYNGFASNVDFLIDSSKSGETLDAVSYIQFLSSRLYFMYHLGVFVNSPFFEMSGLIV